MLDGIDPGEHYYSHAICFIDRVKKVSFTRLLWQVALFVSRVSCNCVRYIFEHFC